MELILSTIEYIAIVLLAYTLKYNWDLYRLTNELSKQMSSQAEVRKPVSVSNNEV